MSGSEVRGIVSDTFKRIQNRREVTKEDLLTLHFFFGSTLRKALDIYDAGMIDKRIASPSGRAIFSVGGSAAFPYIVMYHWCSCPAFSTFVRKGKPEMCKHQLAVRIADATNRVNLTTITDEELASEILEDKNSLGKSFKDRLVELEAGDEEKR
ncbi:hypothetical protein AAMO2058_000077200 [Amorphochlora amoebiformis]